MEKTKISLSVVKEIIKDTPKYLKGQTITSCFDDYDSIRIGCAKKAMANWCYFVYIVKWNGKLQPIATIGQIIQ